MIVGVALILAMIAAACGSGGTTNKSAETAGTIAAKGTPLAIGWIGTQKTADGTSTPQASDGLATWVSWTNAHGGIAGHPVVAYYADDKADPATSLAAVKDLVENKHVIALVGDSGVNTETTWAPYVLEKRIPVIHDALVDTLWFTNPMFYPLGGTILSNIWGQEKAAASQGASKIAFVLCTEIPACAQAKPLFEADAKANGMDPVFSALASRTQATYTAECLAAKQAGAQAVIAYVNTVVFARDCARQGYKPIYVSSDLGPSLATIKVEPSLGNASGATIDFPCLDPLIPAGKEFQAALKQYHPEYAPGGSKRDQFASGICSAWVGGQGFKKAIENAAVASTATATNEDVIKGLSMFNGETLDGLTPPLTLSDGTTPNPQQKCVFLYKYTDGVFSSVPSPGTFTCQP
jgi:branched-chain amino acid transport system substrate-binding protein